MKLKADRTAIKNHLINRFLLIMLMVFSLLPTFFVRISAQDGYSDYSTEKTGVEGEKERTQYGYLEPKAWSEWSNIRTGKPFEVKGIALTEHYAYDKMERRRYWDGAYGKELFTWEFGESARIVWVYLDVDAYVDGSYTNYVGPPLHVYCDGKEIASIGRHDHLRNFYFDTDCNCTLLKVTMDSANDEGRNRTAMVGSWIRVQRDQYRYVTEWDDGHGWRFEEPYETEYGETPKLPSERLVYTHPIIYKINYDLNGGEFIDEPIREYRVIDEIELSRPIKRGYDFLGFDNNGHLITKIPKGTTGDLNLIATWQRNDPKIYAPVKSYRQKEEYDAAELKLGVKAEDELEGDIGEKVTIVKIVYEDGRVVFDPDGLDTSEKQKVYITYRVENSDGASAEVEQVAFILGDGELLKRGEVYPRYISKRYEYTLDAGSIWREVSYQNKLNEVLGLMEE